MTPRNSVGSCAEKRIRCDMYTASSIAQKAGTTVRTLQYYDKIGLLSPTDHTDKGYRLYDETALAVLREILLFRAISIPLKDIKRILNAPSAERREMIERHIEALNGKRADYEEKIFLARVTAECGIETAYSFMKNKTYTEELK